MPTSYFTKRINNKEVYPTTDINLFEVYNKSLELKDKYHILAEPDIQGEEYLWMLPTGRGIVWNTLANANGEDSKAVNALILEVKNEIVKSDVLKDLVKGQNEDEIRFILDNLMRTPDDKNYIYFRHDTDQLIVKIIGWGYSSYSVQKKKGDINISLKYDNGLPIAKHDFYLVNNKGQKIHRTTNDEGIAIGGTFDEGVRIRVRLNEDTEVGELTVKPGRHTYPFIIPRPTVNVDICVKYDDGTAAESYEFAVDNADGSTYTTDTYGLANIGVYVVGSVITLYNADGSELSKVTIVDGQSTYTVTTERPPVKRGIVNIEIKYDDNTPVEDYKFCVKTPEGSTVEYTTDNQGQACIGEYDVDTVLLICLSDGTEIGSVNVSEGESTHTLTIKRPTTKNPALNDDPAEEPTNNDNPPDKPINNDGPTDKPNNNGEPADKPNNNDGPTKIDPPIIPEKENGNLSILIKYEDGFPVDNFSFNVKTIDGNTNYFVTDLGGTAYVGIYPAGSILKVCTPDGQTLDNVAVAPGTYTHPITIMRPPQMPQEENNSSKGPNVLEILAIIGLIIGVIAAWFLIWHGSLWLWGML